MKEEKEVRERINRINAYLDKELGAPYFAVITYIEKTEVQGNNVMHKNRNLVVSNTNPSKTDFATMMALLKNLQQQVNGIISNAFPKTTTERAQKEEGEDTHYG